LSVQLLAHGRWFSPGTPASSTTKIGRHDTAEILLKVAATLNTKNQKLITVKKNHYSFFFHSKGGNSKVIAIFSLNINM
jgi:hypothetical protein